MQACRIAAHDLSCRRGDRVLFAGLGFALGPGMALHLTGPNGVGKSSLLRILAGLLRPAAGRIERGGALALLDERAALDPDQPLERALAFWAALDRAAPAPAALGLAALGEVPARFLSTGQRKRAALARVAASGAAIWLLDEPLNGLDAQWAAEAAALIEAHRAAGGIAVIASHQPLALRELRALDLESHRA